jgi:four helix bundle protein
MRDKGIIYEKAKQFSLQIIDLVRVLQQNGELIISKQIFRSATSIGANYSEALGSESDNDFIHKLSISLKEIHETQYWLDLLKDGGFTDNSTYTILYNGAEELYKMISSSILTVKQRQKSCASHS